MIDNTKVIKPSFEADLTKLEMEKGELEHADIERLRKVFMYAGLTKSSEELESICNEKPNEFQDTLKFGIESLEHYKNLISLLEETLLRIYSVASNHSEWDDMKNTNNLEERIKNALPSESNNHKH